MTTEAKRPIQHVRRVALADDVYEAIKALIMDRQLEPGTKVNMDSLARDLSVSPTPVREALARLESEGLVTKRALVGYMTAPLLDAAGLEELFELRMLLEPPAARWAAERITPAAVVALTSEVATVRREARSSAGDDYHAYRLLSLHDLRFHEAIAEASGRDLLLQMLRRLHPHTQLYRLFYQHGHERHTFAEHGAITRALRAGDPDAAEAAMATHLVNARQRYAAAVDDA